MEENTEQRVDLTLFSEKIQELYLLLVDYQCYTL